MTDNVIHAQHEESDGEEMAQGGGVMAEVMDAVRSELRSNKAQIIAEVKEQSLPAIETAVKRALEGAASVGGSKGKKRQKRQRAFNNRGNERRYDRNEEVIESIEEAIAAIGTKQLDAAKSSLEAGMKILSKQQKLIRLADREENGWEVARYYDSDDLASDSDDEKAINRARREALASIKRRNTDKQKNSFRNAPQRNERERDRDSSHGERYTSQLRREGTSSDRRGGTICYYCGKEGHMQYACPTRYSGTNRY